MELILLNKEFSPIGFLDDFTSLIWTRRYYEPGGFELHAGIGQFALLREAAYLTCKGFSETGIIEHIGYTVETSGRRAYIKGRFLEALLGDRVISREASLSGKPGAVVAQLVQEFSGLTLDYEDLPGFGSAIQLQTTGDNLLTKVYDIAKPAQISIRLQYDYLRDRMTFGVWQGRNRTQEQAEHSWAVFSDQFENISTASYEHSWKDWRNFAYVAGEGEGSARKIVTVDQTEGQPKRELWVDARDLQQKDLTGDQYTAALRQRGLEKLAEYLPVQKADASVLTGANLVYREDYDLGDLCTYIDNTGGAQVQQRITEITEVYEKNQRTVNLTFGEDNKTVRQLLKREVN